MLSVPACSPFTQFRGCSSYEHVGGNIASVDAPRTRSFSRLSADVSRGLALCGPAGPPPTSRRSCRVSASGKEASGGLPASRETAERRKVLLKYVREVQPALVEQFVTDGPPAVVAAMKNTITNMLGTLPPQFFTVTISTVGENMSQLMLSVMMTGYLFRNAQYRLELRNALGDAAVRTTTSSNNPSAPQGAAGQQQAGASNGLQRARSAPQQGSVLDQDAYAPGVQKSRVQGDVLFWHKENGVETLEAVQYIELLEGEVARLRQQLGQLEGLHATQQQHQQQLPPPLLPQPQRPDATSGRQLPAPLLGGGSSSLLQQASQSNSNLVPPAAHQGGPAGLLVLAEDCTNELLEYLRGLDAASLSELTSCADSEVAAAMESFVGRLMGTADRDSLSRAGSDCTAQELAKVMLWIMIVGYTLRGLEVRWDMQKGALVDGRKGVDVRLSCDNSNEAW